MSNHFPGGIEPRLPWGTEEPELVNKGSFGHIHPSHVILPMQENAAAACRPVVTPGQQVALGQLVGSSDANMSILVHASVSGKVLDIGEYPTVNGPRQCVVIQNDFLDTPLETIRPLGEPQGLPPADIVAAVRGAGIAGLGGAAFPTHIKLEPKSEVLTVLVNGCEGEPLLFADDALMRRCPADVLAGCRAVMRAVGAPHGIVCVEDNKPKAAEALRQHSSIHPDIEIRSLPTCYPQGGEKQLIHSVCGREVPESRLSADVGVLVLNAATCAAIADTLRSGMPLVQRVATITGDVKAPQNILFPIGTPAGDLIDACGGFAGTPSKVIIGGPMMGKTIDDLSVPLQKGANGLITISQKHDKGYAELPCIRCNRCAEACPMRLMPLFIDKYARKNNLRVCEDFHAESCINCGCCTYVCPTRRRLAQTIWDAKGRIAAARKEAEA